MRCSVPSTTLPAGNPQAALDAFQARLKDVAQQLDSTKAANRQTDDNLGQSIDQVGALRVAITVFLLRLVDDMC